MTEHEHQASEIIVGMLFTALAVMFLGSPCNRMGKFEGLKGHKAKDCRDILYFLPGSKSGTNAGWQEYRNVLGGFGIRIPLRDFARSRWCAGCLAIPRFASSL